MKGNRTGKGYFELQGAEPVAKKPLTVKLPQSMDIAVRALAKDDLSGWLRDAIAEKLERERKLA